MHEVYKVEATRCQTNVIERPSKSNTRVLTAEERLHLTLADTLPPDLLEALNDPSVVEIMLNDDRKVFVERLGCDKMQKLKKINRSVSEEIIRLVAGILNLVIPPEKPILECEWPLDGSRFAALLPPLVANPVFTIRKRAVKVFTLEEYVAGGIMSSLQYEAINLAITQRKNIIVIGGTGSGKTTLCNAVLHQMTMFAPGVRQIIIEDTCEIQSTADNKVCYHTTLTTSLSDLIRVTLRMRPDRVIVGEVRSQEAFDLLQIWNTGHPGGLCTLHANDCISGLDRLKTLVSMHPYSPREIEPTIGLAVDFLVNIARAENGSRRVTEIVSVQGWLQREGSYVLESIA